MRKLAAALMALALLLMADRAHAQGAMIFGNDAVSTPPTPSLPTSNNYWFTNGNGTSIQGTQVPDYWVNKVGGELNNLIIGLGGSLDMSNRAQIIGLVENWVTAYPHTFTAAQTFDSAFVPTMTPHDQTTAAASDAFVVTEVGLKGNTATFAYTGSAQTWTAPGITYRVKLREWAGGGGGGGSAAGNDAAGGGGAGSYVEGYYTVSPGTTYTINVGAGGTAGAAGGANNGGTGGNTSFTGITVYGGAGGVGASASGTAVGGAGGTAAGSMTGLNLNGNSGGGGLQGVSASNVGWIGGYGAAAPFGGGIVPGNESTGATGNGPGGGGTGGANGGAGGTGAPGLVILEY